MVLPAQLFMMYSVHAQLPEETWWWQLGRPSGLFYALMGLIAWLLRAFAVCYSLRCISLNTYPGLDILCTFLRLNISSCANGRGMDRWSQREAE
ncbi:hypothetical protein VTN96DRAFT_10341 [Rasamsonia emersonii]